MSGFGSGNDQNHRVAASDIEFRKHPARNAFVFSFRHADCLYIVATEVSETEQDKLTVMSRNRPNVDRQPQSTVRLQVDGSRSRATICEISIVGKHRLVNTGLAAEPKKTGRYAKHEG